MLHGTALMLIKTNNNMSNKENNNDNNHIDSNNNNFNSSYNNIFELFQAQVRSEDAVMRLERLLASLVQTQDLLGEDNYGGSQKAARQGWMSGLLEFNSSKCKLKRREVRQPFRQEVFNIIHQERCSTSSIKRGVQHHPSREVFNIVHKERCSTSSIKRGVQHRP
nr:putative uncharacterized protein DDB_G0282129 [Procambarus clarkii]